MGQAVTARERDRRSHDRCDHRGELIDLRLGRLPSSFGFDGAVEPPHAVIETATAKAPRAHNDAWNVREAFICLSFLGGLLSPIGTVVSREPGTTGEGRIIETTMTDGEGGHIGQMPDLSPAWCPRPASWCRHRDSGHTVVIATYHQPHAGLTDDVHADGLCRLRNRQRRWHRDHPGRDPRRRRHSAVSEGVTMDDALQERLKAEMASEFARPGPPRRLPQVPGHPHRPLHERRVLRTRTASTCGPRCG